MSGARVTAHDVARRAGVSQSAVSRAFTPGASVSKATAAKVRRAADALGYRPNVLARAMTTGRSRIIGLVVAYLDNHFYPAALEALSNALQARGYHVLVFMASQSRGDIDGVLEELLDYQVDGIVLASVGLSSDLAARCRAAGAPVVLFNRTQDGDDLSSVTSDNYEGGRAVGRLLADAGHQRIAYVAGWEGASTQRDREAGFRAGLAEAGATMAARAVGDFDMATAQRAARELLGAEAPPDAIFVCNDHMAFAVMDVARSEFGLSVPGDLSLVGFDDAPPAAWPAYDLTTVRQSAEAMVEETVDQLMTMIDDPSAPPRRVTLEAPLIIRGSARLPGGLRP